MKTSIGILLLLNLVLRAQSHAQDGTPDGSFGSSGIVTTSFDVKGSGQINGLLLQQDGKILAAGTFDEGTKSAFAVTRYNADGSLDKSFGVQGYAVLSALNDPDGLYPTFFSTASSLRILPAFGSTPPLIAIAGSTIINGHNAFAIVYLTMDGGWFGLVNTPIGSYNAVGNAMALQTDGKVVVAGYSEVGTAGSEPVFALARFNDVTPDQTFGQQGIVTTPIGATLARANSVAIEPDGNIVAAGYMYNGHNYDFALVRYKTDGSLDTSFGENANGIVTTGVGSDHDVANSVALQTDGRIVVAGYSMINNQEEFALARYRSNGRIDSSFGTNGVETTPIGTSASAATVAIRSDGTIIAAGTSNDGMHARFTVACYNANGSVNASFGTGGVATNLVGPSSSIAYAGTVQSDGKVLVGGTYSNADFTDYDFALARYDQQGTLDDSFGSAGIVMTPMGTTEDVAYSMALQNDGKILVDASSQLDSVLVVIRYDQDGRIDSSFGVDGIARTPLKGGTSAASVVLQDDGKVLTGGYPLGGAPGTIALVRLDGDGTIDSSFGSHGMVRTVIGTDATKFSSLSLQTDGNILFTGTSGNSNPPYLRAIMVRFASNGNLDGSFGQGGIETLTAYQNFNYPIIQSDGRIIVAATFPQGLNLYSALIRFNTDGSSDSTFGTSGRVLYKSGKDYLITSTTVLGGDKFLVASELIDSITFTASFHLDRFTTDGIFDSSFSASRASFPPVTGTMAYQRDGKIVLLGPFDPQNGTFNLGRFTSNGSVDTTFGTAGIVASGIDAAFYKFHGNGPLTRISNDVVTAMGMDASGRIVVSGYSYFDNNSDGYGTREKYNGYVSSSIIFLARYTNSLPAGVRQIADPQNLPQEFGLMQNYPNPFNPKTVIRGQWTGDSDVRLVVYDVLGRQVATLANSRYPAGKYSFTFDGANLASGVYFYRLTAGTFSAVRKMLLIR